MPDDHSRASDVTIAEVHRLVLLTYEAIHGNGQPGIKTQLTSLSTWKDEHDKRHTREVGAVRLDRRLLAAIITAAGAVATAAATFVATIQGTKTP